MGHTGIDLALERAFAGRDWLLIMTRGDRFLDPLRADPRFAAFVSRLGYP